MNGTKTVLVIDDEEAIRQAYRDFFEDNLWTVLEAESGEKALKILQSESPYTAIVDIGMDGT